MAVGEELPAEALTRIFHFLSMQQRCRLACVSSTWRQAAAVDGAKLADAGVPSWLRHVALPDELAQLQAAACPLMALARSAEVTWASGTGHLLEAMPSLERLAFTSMASGPIASDFLEPSGLQSLKSLTNLQSLQLNLSSAADELMESIPSTLREMELHLTGENWQTSVLDQVSAQLGDKASQLASLSLRCSHASAYSSTASLEHLSRLTGLTSLRMGPNPEDVFPHCSPLGFPRLPSFLAALRRLQVVDLSIADAAGNAASLAGISFEPIRHVPVIKLTLRADTSVRAVSQLPAGISGLSGLTSLTVRGFTFDDPGGWCTHGSFDLAPLAACSKLRHMDLQLGTWECEHCEVFVLAGLPRLSQLHSLKIAVASRFVPRSSSAAGANVCNNSDGVQEVLLELPAMKPDKAELHIASSMRVVLQNSKVLAKACSPGVLAHSVLLEEPLPRRGPAAPGSLQQQQQQQQQEEADAEVPDAACGRDQTTPRRPAAPAPAPAPAPARLLQPGQAAEQQYVRAPAAVVIGALPELWPGVEVWQTSLMVPGLSSWQAVQPELLCKAAVREGMQQVLRDVLVAATAAAGTGDDLARQDQAPARGLGLLW